MRAPGPSPHFAWSEFTVNHERPLPLLDRPCYRRLARQYLEPLRDKYGPVTVLSARRTPAYNHAVGGAPGSMHLTTTPHFIAAADVSARRGSPKQWAAFLEGLRIGGLGTYADHVHLDTRPDRARW